MTILTTQYLRACFLRIAAPIYAMLAFFAIGVSLYVGARLTFLEIFLVLILPAILFIIPLFWEFHVRVVQCRKELEDHKTIMNDEGMTDVLLGFAQFVTEHTTTVFFAGHTLASKPLLNLFKLGIVKMKDGVVPAFYAENPHLDYRTRLSKFLDIRVRDLKLENE